LAEIHQLRLPAPGLDERPTPEEIARVPFETIRLLEALLFAATEPVPAKKLAEYLPEGDDIAAALKILGWTYANRGVQLQRAGDAWSFRTAPDLARFLAGPEQAPRKLSRAALETLAVIAYHQPVTRAEVEEVRGVSLSRGTLETLLETGWVRLRGRRRTPGRPVTYGTTTAFLDHFGLESTGDLPDVEELKAAGLLDSRVPAGVQVLNRSEADLEEDPVGEDTPVELYLEGERDGDTP
jgi:segregation and condensation protein B